MLNVIMLSVVMLNVVMLNVIVLYVVAPIASMIFRTSGVNVIKLFTFIKDDKA
jgi:hypothetical protein